MCQRLCGDHIIIILPIVQLEFEIEVQFYSMWLNVYELILIKITLLNWILNFVSGVDQMHWVYYSEREREREKDLKGWPSFKALIKMQKQLKLWWWELLTENGYSLYYRNEFHKSYYWEWFFASSYSLIALRNPTKIS